MFVHVVGWRRCGGLQLVEVRLLVTCVPVLVVLVTRACSTGKRTRELGTSSCLAPSMRIPWPLSVLELKFQSLLAVSKSVFEFRRLGDVGGDGIPLFHGCFRIVFGSIGT